MHELFTAMNNHLDQLSIHSKIDKGETSHGYTNTSRTTQGTQLVEQMALAAYHLDGEAQMWYQLAKADGKPRYKAKVSVGTKKTTTQGVSRTFPVNNGTVSRPVTSSIRQFLPVEIEEHRKKGLCFHCTDIFGPRHDCKKLFIMEARWLEEETDDVPYDSVEHHIDVHQIEESLAISLHAIAGTHTPQTMWVTSTINHRTMSVLLDFGSTHNFLKEELARGMGLIHDPYGSLEVQVANGELISSAGKCKGVWLHLQGFLIMVDFYLLSLEGYDVVLGAQWPLKIC
ncbi:hypothetical protein Pint_04933 [Pistacia integerrima]|uniref:Uncharacterized protein n=1 Tax=Pistacia integerrima TaxID=434235 RepID=A0ACC0ZAL0_9ROSI|nr:hypothetical protein Pint_04933 [Pistacia integerrima]